jgi:hypothetical protein
MAAAEAEIKRFMQQLPAVLRTECRPGSVILTGENAMATSKSSPMSDSSLVQRLFSHSSSLQLGPILLAFVAATSALVGSAITLTWLRPAEMGIPRGFDPGNTKSLAEFLAALCAQSYRSSFPAEAPFLGGNVTAMSKMMTGMAIAPTGNVDPDFVHMMVPHHQGAIEMAVLELHYGHNPVLQRLAQEIVVTQQQEITAMYLAIHEPLPASVPAPTWTDAKPSTR